MSVAEEYGFDFSQEPCINAPWSKYPCRKCLPCLIRRQKAWVARLVEELRQHDRNYFVTLTYDDDHVPFDENGQMCFNKSHLIKLNKDLRKRFQDGRFRNPVYSQLDGSPQFITLPSDVKFRYYITTEYGETTFRPHAHGVWYGLDVDPSTAEVLFRSLWPYGFVSVFPAGEGAAGYISKYLVSDGVGKQSYQDPKAMSPFQLQSNGLGKSYVERMQSWHMADKRHRMYTQYHGSKGTMDRYLKHKIYDEEFLAELSEEYKDKVYQLHLSYNAFEAQHPALYARLLEERKHYFNEMKIGIQWNSQKKHTLK